MMGSAIVGAVLLGFIEGMGYMLNRYMAQGKQIKQAHQNDSKDAPKPIGMFQVRFTLPGFTGLGERDLKPLLNEFGIKLVSD